MVGARLPGVMLDAVASSGRGMLYWQRTYFWAAVIRISKRCLGKEGEWRERTDYTPDTRGDEVHEGVGGVLGLDEHGGALDHGVDGLQTGGFHGFTGF